jgi:hypothetical protein
MFESPSACGSGDGEDALSQYTRTHDRVQQTVISVVLGLAAFLSFCVGAHPASRVKLMIFVIAAASALVRSIRRKKEAKECSL